ncbi:MAG: hypothetical protein M3R55_01400 [Acidobacteriota bacterium]|nr:hypothetical protein [Acidobacteriota bacterium]
MRVCALLLLFPMAGAAATGGTTLTSALLANESRQNSAQRTVIVSVVPTAGGPMRDLTAADFVVREDGKPREVKGAARAREPLYVTLLVDTTKPPDSVALLVRDLRAGLGAFVKTVRGAEPDAQIALYEVAGAAVLTVPFDAPAGKLDETILKLYPGHPADTVILEGIGDAARLLTDTPTPRRAIVVVDFSSSESTSDGSMKRVTSALHASGATVWAVSIRPTRTSASVREHGLNVYTKASGGMRFTGLELSGLETQLQNVANALLSQYEVTFARPEQSPLRNLQMETKSGQKVLPSPMMR